MSSKTAFYILNEVTCKARDLYVCRIIEKAYINNHSIYVHVANLEEAQNFDTQLWTFRDISFIPHEMYNRTVNSTVPVLIGYDSEIALTKDMLINLAIAVPIFYQQFNHIIEVVYNDAAVKAAARKRYQVYQNAGYKIETFNIQE